METTADAQPPRKRARQDEEMDGEAPVSNSTADTSTSVTRPPDFWYDDGSIVLHAESTQFRVHRSILSQNSTVFGDMFGVPQPNHGEPEVEGCLIVHVSDSAQDIAHMLSSLYDRKKDKPTSFARVSAMLRLGKKYDIEYQYEKALDMLQSEFPSTLAKWINKTYGDEGEVIKHEDGLAFDVINLALETNTLSILPVAYLNLARYETKVIMGGTTRKDGSHTTIPFEAQSTCLTGRDALMRAMHSDTFCWLPGSYDDADILDGQVDALCTKPKCRIACLGCVAELWRHVDVYCCFRDIERLQGFTSFCEDCAAIARYHHQVGRRLMWQKLPQYFGLPSWAEIDDLR